MESIVFLVHYFKHNQMGSILHYLEQNKEYIVDSIFCFFASYGMYTLTNKIINSFKKVENVENYEFSSDSDSDYLSEIESEIRDMIDSEDENESILKKRKRN